MPIKRPIFFDFNRKHLVFAQRKTQKTLLSKDFLIEEGIEKKGSKPGNNGDFIFVNLKREGSNS